MCAWGCGGEHVVTGPLGQASCVSMVRTQPTDPHTNPRNPHLHDQTQTFPRVSGPTRWKDPGPTQARSTPCSLAAEIRTAVQPARCSRGGPGAPASLTARQRTRGHAHAHTPLPLAQTHTTEGHTQPGGLPVQYRDHPQRHGRRTQTELGTCSTLTDACNTPRHPHNDRTHATYRGTHPSGYSHDHHAPGHTKSTSRDTHTHPMPGHLYQRREAHTRPETPTSCRSRSPHSWVGAHARTHTHSGVGVPRVPRAPGWGRVQPAAPGAGRGHSRHSRRGCWGGGGSQFPAGTGSPQAQGDRLTSRPPPLSPHLHLPHFPNDWRHDGALRGTALGRGFRGSL